MSHRRVIYLSLGLACILPATITITWLVGRLLSAMQDAAGAAFLDYTALALAVAWAVDLVVLLLALAVHVLAAGNSDPKNGQNDSAEI